MNRLKRYENYKDSDVEWLGKIPEHWEIKKLKYALKFTTGGTPSSGVENYYNGEEPWVTIADMTGRYIEKSHFISKKAVRECNMQIVPKNSLLYSFKLSVGQVAFTKEEIYTNEAIASFYPSKNIDLNFWYYVLPIFLIKNANTNIYGAFLLNQDLIKNALIIFPPNEEQTKIASFLDEKTAQIDEVISQKEKLIELLKERKQIVINDAVTKGLDKDVEFVDSGVEWIGNIPKHWKLLANKYVFNLKKNLVGKKSNEYDLLSLTLEGIIKRDLDKGGKFPAEFDTYQEVKKGDFVFCLFDVEETPRTVGLSKYDGMITGAYTVFSVKNINKEYLYYFYLNLDSKKRLKPLYTGLRNTISKDNFFSFKSFIPPKNEQIKIVEYIENQTTKIDKAIELQQNYISKLKEYKASLIDSVVTGKVKVS
ncbi:restriction endonuclease subunit S [Aliarcobacter cryaerophilus]|uniref:restriction endonuclease subunit S n=1 Tax=Aliarcobacter cryaerophilus TaxID=28198 RepID=UPI003DA5F733